MSLEARKLALIQRIAVLDDDEVEVVGQLLAILEEAQFASFPVMPPRSLEEVKADYDKSVREADEGKSYPHEVVVAYFKQRYRI